MSKIALAALVSLAAGFAAAALLLRTPEPQTVAATTAPGFDASASTEARLQTLETALAAERDARRLVEQELRYLARELERLRDVDAETETQSVAAVREQQAFAPFFRGSRDGLSPEGQLDALMQGGFSLAEAERILRREEELQVEAMQARFAARVNGQPPPANADASAMLRSELGEADYERYLAATGQPTSVAVGHVLESSPGQLAGLQSGDTIVRYDGNRVFEIGDLLRQTMQGTPGESVIVDIERDGVPMQIVLPRGPIGIQSARVFGRR